MINFLLFTYVSATLTLFISQLRKFREKEPLAVSGVVNLSTASVCERWLFQGTQHKTQYNDHIVLEIMLWRYTLVPWKALERSLTRSITQRQQLTHAPLLGYQGYKIRESGGVHSSVSVEDTCKAMPYTHCLQWPAPATPCTSAPNFNPLSISSATQSPCTGLINQQHSYKNEQYKWPDPALSCRLIRLRAHWQILLMGVSGCCDKFIGPSLFSP